MDPYGHHSALPRKFSPVGSLVSVGGMPRFVKQSSDIQTTPAAAPGNENTSAITPFGALTSPFTASTPFAAPITQLSSSLTPLPCLLSPSSTPCTSVEASLSPVTEMHTPGPTGVVGHSESAKSCVSNPGRKATCRVLTPKQVRELRRLCRRTANRAEFEHRHIQVRQVASIYAMASSSLHLFDPDNPYSGRELQIWVESHRENGADWREEYLLSLSAIGELRRWDRLLKTWACSRVQGRFDPESRINGSGGSNTTSQHPVDAHAALQPVRLQFEQLSVETTPMTPLFHCKETTDHQSSGTPPHMHPKNALHRSCASVLGATIGHGTHEFAGDRGSGSQQSLLRSETTFGVAGDGSPKNGYSWKNALFSNSCQNGGGREPLVDVSFNRMTDLINVTVPKAREPAKLSRYIAQDLGCPLNMNNRSPFNEESSPCNSNSKSWRTPRLNSTNAGCQDDANTKSANQSFSSNRRNRSDGTTCQFIPGIGASSLIQVSDSDLYWASLRGGRSWDKDSL
eukprot:TRINITY_DN1446_c0_g1_i1.p1 TRINITY_DN1446_c0_g1~~TRINITY_DN1446_c0_g1_i1.p1  ORF type:complete len:513 (+),score=19.80 TRINITY_DN1446_c0_g1_i1:231-1769(+)